MFLDDRLALTWGAADEDVGQVATESFDGLGARWLRLGVDQFGEVRATRLELIEFGGEVADSGAAGALVERAVLECSEVAVDGRLGGLDLAGDGVEFGGVVVAAFGAELLFGGDGGGDQVGAGVEVDEGLGDGGVDEVGVDAACGAAGAAVPGAGESGVVAVATQLSGG